MFPASSSSQSSSSSMSLVPVSSSVGGHRSSSIQNSTSNISMPKDNNFDQTTARQLLRTCGTLIVENFPPGSEFGIDLSIHYSGENFMGVKMIPPGLHFVHYSMVNKEGSIAPRTGFFHCFESEEMFVTRFNPQLEDIEPIGGGDEDFVKIERFRMAFQQGHLDNRLGAYQFDQYSTWVSLTDYITRSLFERLNPSCGKIYSASTLVYRTQEDGTTTASVDQFGLPDMIVAPETAIRFFSIPPHKHFLFPVGSTPKEISDHSMDSTYTLETILNERDNGDYRTLLGELQFAFVVFLVGHVFDAFEFWRNMLRIICSAQKALHDHSPLYLAFIRVVFFQLRQTNEAIFADIVENENQVYRFMRLFLRNLQTLPVGGSTSTRTNYDELRKRGEKFRQSLKKSLKWNFDNCDDEPDDELPTFVFE